MPRLDPARARRETFGPEHELGVADRLHMGDAAGLAQFGAVIETLAPGSRSSDLHWHSDQDEFGIVLEGEGVLVEEAGETPLRAGDCFGWRAGVENGHCLHNRSAAPVRFLVIGTRTPTDRCRYPALGRTLRHDGPSGTWTVVADDGTVLREGRIDVGGTAGPGPEGA